MHRLVAFVILLFLLPMIFGICPEGSIPWKVGQSISCYTFHSELTQLTGAKMICSGENGDLVSIHDGFTNTFLAQQANKIFGGSPIGDFWIGLTNMINPPNWTWTDESVFDFNNWREKQYKKPRNGENSCGSIALSDGRWNADDCYKNKPFVCKVPNSDQVPTTTKAAPITTTSTTTTTTVPTTTTMFPIFPRAVDIVFILDGSVCPNTNGFNNQINVATQILQNYTLSDNGVRAGAPRGTSMNIMSLNSIYFNNFFTFTGLTLRSMLINCQIYDPDTNNTLDKALRESMSFAYSNPRTTDSALAFVVFMENNGTTNSVGDDGTSFNNAISYRNNCMSPGNIGIIEINAENASINPTLASQPEWYMKYDDPQLVEKATNAILQMAMYDGSKINENVCIDSALPSP